MTEQVHNPSQEFTPEERERFNTFKQTLAWKTAIAGAIHPFTFAKTLFQLGHEPYALEKDKSYVIFGSEVYFLPNVFKYLNFIRKEYSFKALYTGVDANLISNATGAVVSFATSMYLDRYYPEIGGSPENVGKEEAQMTNYESARVKVRQAIRDSIVNSLGIIIARPFTVVMVREIAQHIGHEGKYPDVFRALIRIGRDEGPPGFFSGLVPELIAGLITIWGCASVRYGVERFLENAFDKNDEIQVKTLKDTRNLMHYVIPLAVNAFSYPFMVVSTVMALNGSCLSASQYPYVPLFSHWSDAYDYFKQWNGLTRGSRMFLRKYQGPTSDGDKYASTKHYY
ncbi:mitochondrial carrier like protein 2 [Ditylenchus destructor]|uniref:Mitochondrial carrier like protein 2 n=1 Tax=Ditylenchus destructor TaxID=166010 RepID=A0AAD4RCN0_9BILA|nr:mitochondrial carrier like protein 2 [Ditylenchus destructor]